MKDELKSINDLKIVTIAPLARGILTGKLSYFMTQDVKAGDLITVPVKNRQVSGLVITVESATKMREAIRRQGFQLKKLQNVKAVNLLTTDFINASIKSAVFFSAPIGVVISSLIPSYVLDLFKKSGISRTNSISNKTKNFRLDERVVQAPDEERLTIYRGLIRESFARKSSVFFCTPDIKTAEVLFPNLTKGIPEYSFLLHNDLPKKIIQKNLSGAISESHPVVIVGTSQFLFTPREDFDTIVMECESNSWKQVSRPHIDTKVFARFLAKERGNLIVYGDNVLSVATAHRYHSNLIQELSPLRQRLLSPANEILVDLKSYDTSNDGHISFNNGLSNELIDLISASKQNNERAVLLVNRRGLFTTTVCGDCGNTLLCSRCKVPLTLHRNTHGSNVYVCHLCQEVSNTDRYCPDCRSWKLYTHGTGIEKIQQLIHQEFPNLVVFTLSSDTANTRKKAISIINSFISSPGSILLGTEMLLLYLSEQVENSAVVFLDNMFTIPDFKSNERIFNILAGMKRLAKKSFIVQTRLINEKVFDFVMRGTILDFYRDEISQRDKLKYPPFSLLIKISRQGQRAAVERDVKELESLLEEFQPAVVEAFLPSAKGLYKLNIILRLEPNNWPNAELSEILSNLPPIFDVDVMPDNLL